MNCPSCGIAMKLLLTSYYCPNDCDKKSSNELKSIELKWNNKLWKMALINPGEDCPSWATHRWWLWESDWNLENLVKQWGCTEGPFEAPDALPGWLIANRPDGARTDHSQSVVFCRIPKTE